MEDQMTPESPAASPAQLFRLVGKVQEVIPTLELSRELAQRHIESNTLPEVVKIVLSAEPGVIDLDKLSEMAGYPDEEEESEYGYPEGFEPTSPAEKLAVLAKHFPDLDGSHVNQLAINQGLLAGEEEMLVCPKPSKVSDNINDALVEVLALLYTSRNFRNWRDGQLGPELMRLTDKTAAAIAKLEAETPGDYLVFPVQMGLKHRGRSVRRARACFKDNEFGLSPFEVACYLLTTPERFGRWEDLAVDCAGVEYRFEPSDEFENCLYFDWGDGRLHFRSGWIEIVSGNFGSASGFLR